MGKEWFAIYRGNRWIGHRVCRTLPLGECSFWVLTGTDFRRMSVKPFVGIAHTETRALVGPQILSCCPIIWRQERPNVKKVKLAKATAVKHVAALETEMFRDCLAICEFLAMLQYEDGSPRIPGYCGVWCQGATWVVRATDKDADATLTGTGRTLDEAVQLLALLLGAEDAPWEPNSRREVRKGKKAA